MSGIGLINVDFLIMNTYHPVIMDKDLLFGYFKIRLSGIKQRLFLVSNIHFSFLQKTRLGRYVNIIRKAAKDASLAKRAKNLIKSWQQLIKQGNSQLVII